MGVVGFGEEFTSGGDAQAVVEGFDVVVDGVGADAKAKRDLFFAQAGL